MQDRGVLHGVELTRSIGCCTREGVECARVAFLVLCLFLA